MDNYNIKDIGVFKMIGCYFVDIFYNYLYILSVRKHRLLKEGTTSITDFYKSIASQYVVSVAKNKDYYLRTIDGLYNKFKENTKYGGISLSELTKKITTSFMPADYYSSLNDQERDFFLNKILIDVVTEFCIIVIKTNNLNKLIDDHTNIENTKIWIDYIITVQVEERERIFSKFLKNITNTKENTVSSTMFDKLKNNFVIVLKQKCKMEEENKLLYGEIKKQKQNAQSKMAIITSLKRKNIGLNNDLKILREKILRTNPEIIADLEEHKQLSEFFNLHYESEEVPAIPAHMRQPPPPQEKPFVQLQKQLEQQETSFERAPQPNQRTPQETSIERAPQQQDQRTPQETSFERAPQQQDQRISQETSIERAPQQQDQRTPPETSIERAPQPNQRTPPETSIERASQPNQRTPQELQFDEPIKELNVGQNNEITLIPGLPEGRAKGGVSCMASLEKKPVDPEPQSETHSDEPIKELKTDNIEQNDETSFDEYLKLFE